MPFAAQSSSTASGASTSVCASLAIAPPCPARVEEPRDEHPDGGGASAAEGAPPPRHGDRHAPAALVDVAEVVNVLKLPKDVVADPRHDEVVNLLTTHASPLWASGRHQIATL